MNQAGVEDRETGEVTLEEDRETGEVTRNVTRPDAGQPACPHVEEPACPHVEEPACPTGEDPPACLIGEDLPAFPTVEDPPACLTGEDPPAYPAVEDPPACPTVEDPPGCPTVEDPPGCPTVEDPPACPTVEDPPACPTVEDPPACPTVEDPPACPTVEDPPACSPQEEPVSPTGELACPESTYSTGEQLASAPRQELEHPLGAEPGHPLEEPVHPVGEASASPRDEDQERPQAEAELENLIHEDDGDAIEAEDSDSQEEDDPPSVGICGRGSRLRRMIPAHYRAEMWKQIKLAAPLLVCEFLNFMIWISCIKVTGNKSVLEHSIVAMAFAVYNVVATSIGNGLAQACDTLISQTSGSGNHRRAGRLLQRGIGIMVLTCFPCWAVLIYTEPFLLYLTHDTTVASVAQMYVYVQFVPVAGYFMYQLQVKYLQNQGHVLPQVVTAVAGSAFHFVLIYFFLDVMQARVNGFPMAILVSFCVMPLLLCLLMVGKGIQKGKWSGWGEDSFQEWGPFAKMAFLSATTVCLQCWVFEIWPFLDGYDERLELGTRSMVYSLYMAAFTIPLAFAAAASARVGNALGAGDIMEAKLAAKVAIICGVAVGLFIGVFMAALKDYSGYLIFENWEMVKKAANVVLLFALLYVLDTAVYMIEGVLRGAGQLLLCALTALARFGFGLFIGLIQMNYRNMGLMGFGIGIIVGVAVQLLFLIFGLYRLDWQKAAEEARKTAGVLINDGMEMKNGGPGAAAPPPDPPLRVSHLPVMGERLTLEELKLRRWSVTGAVILLLCAAAIGKPYVMKMIEI